MFRLRTEQRASLLGARTLLVAPGHTSSNKKLLGTSASLLGTSALLLGTRTLLGLFEIAVHTGESPRTHDRLRDRTLGPGRTELRGRRCPPAGLRDVGRTVGTCVRIPY